MVAVKQGLNTPLLPCVPAGQSPMRDGSMNQNEIEDTINEDNIELIVDDSGAVWGIDRSV